MKGYIVLALLFAFNAVCSEKVVICYYGSWATYRIRLGRFTVENINPHLCTHLVYAFAGINAEGLVSSLDPGLDLPDGEDNFRFFNGLKKKNPKLKTILSVGGWSEGSAKFSKMAASPTLRKNFIESAILFINEHGFDGLDINWLSPNQRDSVNREADVENFTVLLKEIRGYFNERGLLLTIAVTASEETASKSYNVAAMVEHVHFINLMAYDMNGPWNPHTDHNSALYKGKSIGNAAKQKLHSVDKSVDYWLRKGCPPEKLVLGVSFYGHTYKLKSANDNGVKAPASGPGIRGPFTKINGAIGYNELCTKLQRENWTVRRDSEARVPYAVDGDNWVSYDDSESIREKVQFAMERNLAGIMTWSVETDDFNNVCGQGKFPLLTVVNEAISKATAQTQQTTQNSSVTNTNSIVTMASAMLSSICQAASFF